MVSSNRHFVYINLPFYMVSVAFYWISIQSGRLADSFPYRPVVMRTVVVMNKL